MKKTVFPNLQVKRKKQVTNFFLGVLVRTADNKKVFSKRDCANWSYILYTINEILHDTIPTYRIDYLPERYNEQLLKSTKSTLQQSGQVLKNLNLLT